jgi:seryl-tRNA synthetase
MLDIKFIKDNPELIKEAARKKHLVVDIDALLALEDKRLKMLSEIETLRARQNRASEDIVKQGIDDNAKAKIKGDMKLLKQGLTEREAELANLMSDWQALMLTVPNIPDVSVPEGDDDSQNVEVRRWGDLPQFDFAAKSHVELMVEKGWADFERGAKVAGFRGYFLKGEAVRLSFAIWQYALDFFAGKEMVPMIVPSLVRRENLFGTGYLPQGEEDLYKTQDGEFLAGTAEVATMGYYAGEVLAKETLPIKHICFSPCFRREAGAHSKDVKGLIRVHEFYKLEQVLLCEASHEESVKWHEWLNRNTEEFIESLGIPYHTVANCGGDLGQGQVKKYDIELWVPLENKYREISSASYFHDFQTRRLNTRYKDVDGKLRYAHSLNSTAIPTPRILVSLIENFQLSDGSVKLPAVLVPYMGKEILT